MYYICEELYPHIFWSTVCSKLVRNAYIRKLTKGRTSGSRYATLWREEEENMERSDTVSFKPARCGVELSIYRPRIGETFYLRLIKPRSIQRRCMKLCTSITTRSTTDLTQTQAWIANGFGVFELYLTWIFVSLINVWLSNMTLT